MSDRRFFVTLAAAALLATACGFAFAPAHVVVRDAARGLRTAAAGLESACAYYEQAPNVKRTKEADEVCRSVHAAGLGGNGGAGGSSDAE